MNTNDTTVLNEKKKNKMSTNEPHVLNEKKKNKIVALIPAKKKSTRLPNKNLRKLNNLPLVAHTILAALECFFFDHVIVLTDSEEIKELAHVMGATPMHDPLASRDPEPSGGELTIFVIDQLSLQEEDIIIYLQPTSPLRDSVDIQGAHALFMERCSLSELHESRGKTVVSVCRIKHHPSWCFRKNGWGFLHPYSLFVEKSQHLEPLYVLNGALYISRVKDIRENRGFFHQYLVEYLMDEKKSIDIDNEHDFFMAEATIKWMEYKKKEAYLHLENP